MADEYRTKELLTDALNAYKHLVDQGFARVRFVTHSLGSSNNWGNFKPLMVIGYTSPKGNERYLIFTSKFYVDKAGHKTTMYSSIRLAEFKDGGLETIKFPNIDNFRKSVRK